MAKVPYVPYNDTMAQIFAALNISLAVGDYGGKRGWDPEAYDAARATALEMLVDYDTFDYDDNGSDDWAYVNGLLTGERVLAYWSTESGHMPT